MRIAILGDIHGNHLALEAVLGSAVREGVDRLLVTGDLVGYYPFVKEVLELLGPWDTQIVKGNHEVMLQDALVDSIYLEQVTRKYGSSIKIAIAQIPMAQLEDLINLPQIVELDVNDMSLILCHGSPVKIDEYIYPDTDLSKLSWLNDITSELIICGHTHYPMLREWNGVKILNPGSVGQSRNGISKAHWVLFDVKDRSFRFMVEDYNINPILDAVKDIDPENLYLQKVLTR